MTISYVSESHTNSASQYATSVVVSRPASYASGDLFIAIIGGTRTGSVPSGWTQLGTSTCGSSTGTVYVYYKIAGGSEASTYTFDTSGGSGGARLAFGSILCYRGADTTTPLDTTNFNLATDTGTDFTTASVTANGTQWSVSFAVVYRGTSGNATITAGSGSQRGSTFGVSASGENTSYAAFDSNGNVASGSTSRTQTVTSAAAGCRGIFLINDSGTSVDAAQPSASVTAYAATTQNQYIQTNSATVDAYAASVTIGVPAESPSASAAANAAIRGITPESPTAAATAYQASVHIYTETETAEVSVTATGSIGYYGASNIRTFSVKDENRVFKVRDENRVFKIYRG